MQRIFQTSLTPEQYAEQDYHKQVPPPDNCDSDCGGGNLGSALGRAGETFVVDGLRRE